MTDRVYPSSKPNGTTTTTTKTTAARGGATATATTTPNSRLPPPPRKTQIPNRHPDRPNPTTTNRRNRRRSRRGCFCLCCFWSILILILLLLIAAVAGCILYLLYHPHRPTFSIAALKISEFNLTTAADDTTHLTSALNLTISTRNPNKKIQFHYDPIAITCLSHETLIANGSFPDPLVSGPNNVSVIRSSLYANSMLLDTETVNQLRFHINNKKKPGLPLKILLDTSAQVKIESMKTKKVGIRIQCEGIHSLIPKNGGGKRRNSSSSSVVAVSAIVTDAKCKMDLRSKLRIWSLWYAKNNEFGP
ncbi:hypothetical protein OSB04_022011 [Centaurea solstitialis]|uniref:Late embryogenesis abundant protein LEA-2 subgroup domain-containing protein n=1 Tax=Centaurea solstitialis TaxID=347529 RepID=A0AA38T322_9ASTR|nr:hypothetical protein OSB04_022011 [Centaurea solstitialis]